MTACAPAPFYYFYRNFGVFPLHQIAHVGVSKHIHIGFKLFGGEIIFEDEEFQRSNLPVYAWARYR